MLVRKAYDNYYKPSSNIIMIIRENEKIRLNLWDSPGNESQRSLAKNFINNSKIVIIVYDITNRSGS